MVSDLGELGVIQAVVQYFHSTIPTQQADSYTDTLKCARGSAERLSVTEEEKGLHMDCAYSSKV